MKFPVVQRLPMSRIAQYSDEMVGVDLPKIGPPKKREPKFSSPKAIEAISLNKNLSARISLPTETQDPEEKFVPANEGHPSPRSSPETPTPVQLPVQVEERWIDFPDGRMRYLKAGSGPALILVHGLMGYSFSWRFSIPALAPHATVYAVDNLGAGFSPVKPGRSIDCRLRATAERLLEFADALGIEQFDLLGTSHGGGVAIMTAAICAEQNNSRLGRLVLVAPINPWSPHGRRFAPFLGSPLGTLLFHNTIERWRSLDYVWLCRLFGDASKIPPDSLAGYRMPMVKNQGLRHALHIVRTWTADMAELEAALPKIRDSKTLLMWGTKDRAVDFRSAEPLRQNFRNVRLAAFKGVGHLPYEEAPNDFNRALVNFLTERS
jgi:pimeloyl-ACP methyl ester carboxylesterase